MDIDRKQQGNGTCRRKTIQFPDLDLHREIMILSKYYGIPAPEVIRKGIEILKNNGLLVDYSHK